MAYLDILRSIARRTGVETTIVLFVVDGLGGLPGEDGRTEMEAARLPNLDALTVRSVCGLIDPVGRGITPGSGPGHLALFGYDPVKYIIGRGALEAAGIGFLLEPGDVAARFNFCTLDAQGRITDRRAGRLATEKNKELVSMLQQIEIPGVEVFVETVKEHRGLVVFRGEELHPHVADTDPQTLGKSPLGARALDPASTRTAAITNEFITAATEVLRTCRPANGLLLRGFSSYPNIPTLGELYGIKSVAIALYPMYRGVARYVGMDVKTEGIERFDDELRILEQCAADYDFLFLHYKHTDTAGEDRNFDLKVQRLEEVDAAVPRVLDLNPDVLVVTGDHSTPATFGAHSWHPVPILLHAPFIRTDDVAAFTENACLRGGLGRFPAQELMALMLAHAGRLEKYGA